MEPTMSENWQQPLSVNAIPESIIWIPCIPNLATGTLVPLYNLNNCPHELKFPSSAPKISRGGIKSQPWSYEEDAKLSQLVTELGLKQWSTIAKALNEIHENKKLRKGKHCRERWYNHLNPEINKGEWSFEEDILLLTQQKQVGNKWSSISRMLKGRTENAVKNRWTSLIKNFKQDMNLKYMSDDSIAEILIKELENQVSVKESN